MKPLKDKARRVLFNKREDELIRVYSFQSLEALEHAEQIGYWTGTTDIDGHNDVNGYSWFPQYTWMKDQMAARLSFFSGDYPKWVYFSKPNMRKIEWSEEPSVFITADIPKKRILISDHTHWHAPLNGWFISKNEQEDEEFHQMFPNRMPQTRFAVYPKEMMKTWERIFDFRDDASPDIGWYGKQRYLQGCVDRFYPNEIVSIKLVYGRKGKPRKNDRR